MGLWNRLSAGYETGLGNIPGAALVRWARSFYFMLACSTRTTMELQAYRLGYSQGYNTGIREGREQGKKDTLESVHELVKVIREVVNLP